MINELDPHPAMRDSGVPWLAEMPEHWDLERAKWLFRRMDRPVRETDEVVTCFRDGVVTLRKHRRVRGFTESLQEIGYQGIRQGDLVIHAMDAFAGAVGVADSDGKGTPVYSVCEPAPNANAHYYAWVVREMARSQWILALAKGIRERSTDFRFEGFASQPVPLPPLPEQAAIVRFLDHADRRIRRATHAKQKLIALLNEQKQAVVHRAVTRGLDPDVRLKPSGVEWLGAVPAHWEVRKLKHLTRFRNGSAFKPGDWSATGVPIIRIQNLNGANEFNYTTREDLPRSLLIRTNDLLFAWSGNRGTSFGSFVWDRGFDGYLNQHIFKLEGYTLDRRYFLHLLRAVTRHVEEQTHGIIGLVHITKPELGAVLVPVAPHDEQTAIARFIDEQTASLEVVTRRAQREIALLREYRTRLIADVVTGKLDVRDAAARLPDAAEEPEHADEVAELSELDDEVDDVDLDEAVA